MDWVKEDYNVECWLLVPTAEFLFIFVRTPQLCDRLIRAHESPSDGGHCKVCCKSVQISQSAVCNSMQCLVSQSAACLESGSVVSRHAHVLSVEQHSLVEANDVNLVKYYFLSLHCKKNDEKVMN